MFNKQTKQFIPTFFTLLMVMGMGACDSIEDLKSYKEQVFIKTFGGTGSEESFDIKLLPDGGFVMVGSTTSFSAGDKDVYLVRADRFGNELWSRSYGGPGNDIGRSVELTNDGGFIICGEFTELSGTKRDIYLIKTDDQGIETNSTRLGIENRDEVGTAVIALPQGGYFVTGTNIDSSGFYLAELNDQLEISPSKEKTNVGQDGFFNQSVASARKSLTRYYCYGTSTESDVEVSKNTRNLYFFEFDPLGDNAISPKFIGTANNETATSMCELPDQGFILGGYTIIGDREQPYLVKINASGIVEWEVPYSRASSSPGNTRIESVKPTIDGGIVAVTTTERTNFGREIGIMKFDINGNVEWVNSFGGEGDDFASAVVQLEDGSYVITGSMAFVIGSTATVNNKMFIIKANPQGQLTVEQ